MTDTRAALEERTETETAETETLTLERSAIGIHHLAADDDDRPVLACVRAHDGWLTATDGFVAAEVEAPGMTPEEPLLLNGSDLAELRKRTSPKAGTAELEPHKDGAMLGTGAAKPKQPVVIETADGTYPDARALYHGKAPRASVVLNASLLEKLLRWLGPDAADGAIQFRVHDRHESVEIRAFTTDSRRMRGLIMPMVAEGGASGAWFQDGLTETDPGETGQDGTERG